MGLRPGRQHPKNGLEGEVWGAMLATVTPSRPAEEPEVTVSGRSAGQRCGHCRLNRRTLRGMSLRLSVFAPTLWTAGSLPASDPHLHAPCPSARELGTAPGAAGGLGS